MAIVSSSSVTDALSDLTDSNEELTEDDREHHLSTLSNDYSEFLKVDVSSEKKALEEAIDDMLTHLDEFSGLVDMVRCDDSLCLMTTLPDIFNKSQDLEQVFEKIDKLEAFVGMVKQNVLAMESKVAEAENSLDGRLVKKIFSSFQNPLFTKKSPQYKRQLKYDPLDLYKTDDFIKSPEGPLPPTKLSFEESAGTSQ